MKIDEKLSASDGLRPMTMMTSHQGVMGAPRARHGPPPLANTGMDPPLDDNLEVVGLSYCPYHIASIIIQYYFIPSLAFQ